ncbi:MULTISPECIES: zinc-dependent metalloprotease [Flavobacterium]|uniref:M43 family zinc metalloprotease n=1 Tax=Flavobacterium jumunjinense TaxID=998845 RepID=A0ABV5GU32_9FLAO|nr:MULTISPECIES: zinc-dependent metalloprotease [Flavobacterium]
MKTKLLCLFLFLFVIELGNAQHLNCRVKEENDVIYRRFPQALKEKNAFEKQSSRIQKNGNYGKAPNATYTIPVVFHVYGTSHNGLTVTSQKIVTALQKVNDDFNGLNPDFNSVESFFQSRRSTLNIEFKLAKIDPNGACTTGIIFHDVKSGFGNGGGYDSEIQADAWDNYKYMNVYIQNDLYDDGETTNSGVAWYPNTSMSDYNLARVVYNGAYLYGNTSDEFASVLTHEFGHFFDLIHTFEGGCTGSDQVSDTPLENGTHDLSCTPGTNCNGDKVNIENYMGYNGASGCYKMFTQGQVNRMLAALQHPARTALWQNANLTATGVNSTGGYIASATATFKEDIANNGTFTSNAVINATAATFSQSNGVFTQGTHYTHTFPAGLTPVVTVNSNSQVTVTLNGTATSHLEANNVTSKITFLPAAFTGSSTIYCNSISYSVKFRDPYGIFFVDMNDATVAGSTTWKYFEISRGDSKAYGAWIFATNHLKLETYGKRIITNTGSRNITRLGFNVPINASNNFTAPGAYPDQLDIRTSSFTNWDGETGYIGFEYKIDGETCYGWFKANVAAGGSSYTITEYAYNTEPGAIIYTGMTPKTVITVSPNTLAEDIANNGSFSTFSAIKLSTNNGTFTQSTGTFTQGTHYTISGVPTGLTPVLTLQNNNEVKLTLTGNATQHDQANNTNLVITFNNAAITGGISSLESNAVTIALNFENPYGIYYVDNADLTVSASNVWEYFTIEPDADDDAYGLFVDASSQNSLRLETYGKALICNGTTRNVTYLGLDEPVNATRNFVDGGAYPDLHVIRSTQYTTWDNQTGYIGFRYYRNGNPCYGWFKVIVSPNGSSYTLTNYAYNTEPNGTIYTPSTLSGSDFDNDNNFSIYPNPFNTSFTIELNNESSTTTVIVSTLLGQEVFNRTFNNSANEINIDLNTLSKGIYLVKIIDDKGTMKTKKVIKKQ